ncbi:MAG: hypothetical protein WAS75_11130, partial [Candidatus Microthrix subdominans]
PSGWSQADGAAGMPGVTEVGVPPVGEVGADGDSGGCDPAGSICGLTWVDVPSSCGGRGGVTTSTASVFANPSAAGTSERRRR